MRLLYFIWNLLICAATAWTFLNADNDWVNYMIASSLMAWIALSFANNRDDIKYEGLYS